MGLVKFWLKHGPGSPGSIAKRMANSYVTIYRRDPSRSHEAILELVLAQRYAAVKLASPDVQQGMLRMAEGNLAELVIEICKLENPRAFPVSTDVYATMIEGINEVFQRQIPADILTG